MVGKGKEEKEMREGKEMKGKKKRRERKGIEWSGI